MSKFDSPLTEWIYREDEWDEEVGDSSSGVGWAGLWRIYEEIDGGVIIFEESDGSVHKEEFLTDAELFVAWAEVEERLGLDGPEPEEGDWVIQDNPRGYYVSQSGQGEEFPGTDGIDPILRIIARKMAESEFYPNVWHVSDHGNYMLLDLQEMGIN